MSGDLRRSVSRFDPWQRLAALLVRSRWPFVLLVVGLSLAATYGATRPTPPHFAGIRSLSAKDPKTAEQERLRKETSEQFRLQRPDLFLLLEAGAGPTRSDVRAMRRAVAALEQLPQVEGAIWVDDIPSVNVFELTRSILPSDELSEGGFVEELTRLERHPLGRGQFVSEDGRSFLVAIRLDWLEIFDDGDAVDALLAAARSAIAEVPEANVTVDATGDVPLYLDQLTAHRRNQRHFEMLGYALVIVVASVLYRSPAPVMLVGIAPATAIFWSKGLLRWWGESANPLSDSVLPVLVAIVGVTDGVHLLAQYRDERAREASARAAAAASIRHVGSACFLTSLTTAIGFASLLFADSELVRGFGRSCAIGVSLAFVAIVTVFPLVASFERIARWVPGLLLEDESTWHVDRWLSPLRNRARSVAAIGIAVTLLASLSLFGLKPDEKRSYGLPSRSAAFMTLERADEAFAGIETAQVLIRWPESADASAELLAVLDEVERCVTEEPTLGRPLSLLGLRRAIAPPAERPPLDFVELLPSGIRDSLYRPELRKTVVSFRVRDLGVAKLDPIFARIAERLESLERRFPGYSIALTGDGVVRGKLVARVVEDLGRSLFGAAGIIFALLAIAYRSWRWGLIAIIPNLFPLAVSACGLLLIGRQLDVSSACAFTVCLGIAVDDTIHFLGRYRREREAGGTVDEAIETTLRKVGGSLVVTTVIMTVGFATVISSEMPAQRIFGTLSVATIVSALLGDLLILPAMLRVFDRDRPLVPSASATLSPPVA